MKRKIQTPAWVNGSTVYEVNIRQFTQEGTIAAFEEHLPQLKELGVGILWLMPVYPIGQKNRKGSLGSYYSISNYKEINPELGNMNDFKGLVQKAHALGMKVIIDWVANHTAWDHHWTIDHPEFYSKDEDGGFKAPVPDWEDVIHLDYGNPDLWDEMIGQMCFWLRETGIDGFRCDMAHLVPTLFWNRARRELDKIQPVYMLAESENHDLLEYAFDTLYNWKVLHAMNELAAGNINASELLEVVINEKEYLPEGASTLNFTSNHDENSWQGSAIERIHYYLEPLSVLTFLIPGVPLIYSGQEAGNYRRLEFFEKDSIDWKEDKMFGLYKKLSELVKDHPVLGNDAAIAPLVTDSPDKILSFVVSKDDKQIVYLANLSAQKMTFYIKCDKFSTSLKNLFIASDNEYSCHQSITIDPYKFLILG